MSEEYMESIRKLTKEEEHLLEQLIEKASVPIPTDWRNNLFVLPMEDGDMGSLRLNYLNLNHKKRVFGRQISELEFIDKDGVKVIVSLNIDNEGILYELDIWKTNFNKLVKIRTPD